MGPNSRHSLAHRTLLGAALACCLAPAQATAQDLAEADLDRRVSRESAAARLLAATARLQPIVWEGEIDRRVRAAARLAFAQLVAAQGRLSAIQRAVRDVSEIAASLARAEQAGDAAGFDRLEAERVLASLQATAADGAERRSRAQADLAAYFGDAPDPRQLRAAPAGGGSVGAAEPSATRADLPAAELLVGRALALAREAPPTGASPVPPDRQAAVAARRAEVRVRVLALAQIVADRRAALATLRQSAAAADVLERIARVSYDNGIRTALDLVDACRAGAETRLALIDAALALRRAELELEELVGENLS